MKKTLLAMSISILAVSTFNADADALIGSKLQSLLPTLVQQAKAKVIVSTHQHNELKHVMSGLNVPYLALTKLPMAGASLTQNQIRKIHFENHNRAVSHPYDP